MKLRVVLILLTCVISTSFSAKILALFHFPCKSHHILGSTLLKALAANGHEVTMVSPFPFQAPVANYKDIEITGMLEYKEKHIVPKFVAAYDASMYDKMTFSIKNAKEVAELFLEHPNVKKLLSSNQKFDVVLLNWSMNEALLAIAHHFQTPVIAFSTIGSSQLTNKITRNPAPYSYIPNLFVNYGDDMTFFQRLSNAFWSAAFETVDHLVNEGVQQELLAKYFPKAPPLQDLINNVSLVFINSHYGIESPRPYVPNMIEIGGFHVESPKGLTGDLKKFLDGAPEGVIFFSLGTNVKSSHLPEEKLQAIVNTFANLKVKVLWKFETYFKDLPKNVMANEWLPQTDVLAHPNVKGFVTHGGRLSTIEAIHFGVPIIGIPFFSDQEYNIADSVNMGYGIKVDFASLTQQTLGDAINEILNNPRYRNNAKRQSAVLTDQPVTPMDSAIFWVEYVIRHRGAPHLQTGALKLRWWQYLLLDVIAFVVGISVFLVAGIYLVVRKIFRALKPKSKKKTKKN